MNRELVNKLVNESFGVITGADNKWEYAVGFEHEEQVDDFVQLIIKECIWEIVKDNKVSTELQLLITQRINERFGIK